MITTEQRKNKLHTSNNLIKEMYGSMVLATIIKPYKNTLEGETYNDLIDVIGDIILGFYTTIELPTLLQKEAGVGADDALRIVSDLQDFLAPVIAREKGETNPNHEELKDLQDTFTPAPAEVHDKKPIETVNVDTPEELDSATTPPQEPIDKTTVQAMRTMEGDMSRVHGYGAYRAQFPDETQETEYVEEVIRSASQEDILKAKPVLTDIPTYEEGEGEEK